MGNLSDDFDNLKLRYRETFLKTARDIQTSVCALKPPEVQGEIFDNYEEDSPGRAWENDVIKKLYQEYGSDRLAILSKINQNRQHCSCIGCGVCCKLACSEFSPAELRLKAQSGDNFAKQFIEIFVPYESAEEAGKIYHEYMELLRNKQINGYYFYHCPKVTEDNRCPDYENRPQICRDFPDNPLAFLPKTCGFADWKLQSEDICLKLNAEAEIINFYIAKIKESQKV